MAKVFNASIREFGLVELPTVEHQGQNLVR